MKSKVTPTATADIQSLMYNRIEDQVLKALYNGSTAATDLKKFTLSSLTRFFEQKCEKMKDVEKRDLYEAITGKKSTKSVNADKLATAGTNYLSENTDLFTKRIKPSLVGLTVNEGIVLKILCTELATWRVDEPSYSCVTGEDVTKRLKEKSSTWNAKSTAGVVGSLSKKGYLNVEASGDFKDIIYPCWHRIPKNFPSTLSVEQAINPNPTVKAAVKSGVVEAKVSAEAVKSIAEAVKKAIDKKQTTPKVAAPVAAVPSDKKKKKATAPKSTPEERENMVAEESFTGKKYKPFAKYGLHGSNVKLDGFTKGTKVSFMLKGEQVIGDFIHFHINNHSPKGYAVIKYDGKIIERAAGKFSLAAPAEPTIEKDKKVPGSTKKAAKTATFRHYKSVSSTFDTAAIDKEVDKMKASLDTGAKIEKKSKSKK